MPRVTLCIPTYKRTRWLAGTIESALAQTFTDLIVEVHDDATPGDAIAEVAARYPAVKYVRHATNAGIVGNFTRSLLGAETEYVLQLGDDDEAHPRLVEETVAALDAHPSAGVAHARFTLIDADGAVMVGAQDWLGTPSPPLERGEDFVARSMDHGCRICSSTALIRRAAVPEGGFREEDFPQFDFAFWLRMAERWDVAFVAEPLCRYRIHARQSHVGAQRRDGHGLPAGGADAARGACGQAPARGDARGANGGPSSSGGRPSAAARHRRRASASARFRTVRSWPRRARWGTPRGARRRCCASRPPGRCWPAACVGPRAVERLKGRA